MNISFRQWLSRLLPNDCLLCRQPSKQMLALCDACIAGLPWRTQVYCTRCGLDLIDIGLCGHCLRWPPKFDRLIAAFDYCPPVDHFIYRLKFGRKLIYAQILGELLAYYLINEEQLERPQCIIPVPLHRKRLQQRGFNQAALLAKRVAKHLNLPFEQKLIRRSKPTAAQARLKAPLRHANLQNAFSMIKPVHYDHVALVDDVVTTGATVNSISELLKQAGVKQIDIYCTSRGQIRQVTKKNLIIQSVREFILPD